MAEPSTPLTIVEGLQVVLRASAVVQGGLDRLPSKLELGGHPATVSAGGENIAEGGCGTPFRPPATVGDLASLQQRIVTYLGVIAGRIARTP